MLKGYVLVTGGTGYIGSHTVIELLNNDYKVVIVDNLCNSKALVVDRIEKIAHKRPDFIEADVRDKEKMREIFKNYPIDAVIHFAGLKAVGESVEKPQLYYDNNIGSTEVLLEVMKEFNCKNIVFSSSATVFGNPKRIPIFEDDPTGEVTNPYAETKVKIEIILKELAKIDSSMNIAILRYFNPIGAHKSGLIGEDPNGIPNNLMTYITQVAIGKLPFVHVFGSDYKTKDGTGVRDYIHVVDLALGHVATLKKLEQNPGLVIYNLGTGIGTSVIELIEAFKMANKIDIPYRIEGRRPGDIDECYANCDKAFREMGWKTKYNMVDCCKDSWNWQSHNPKGYEE